MSMKATASLFTHRGGEVLTLTRVLDLPKDHEMTAWKWMRYSGLLLIPLAWGHLLTQDVLVGVDRIDLK